MAWSRVTSDAAALPDRTRAARRHHRHHQPVEAFHGFSHWLMFGGDCVLADNDPEHQEKIIKFNELMANCVIFHSAVEITAAVNELVADSWDVDPDDPATISPYITSKIRRFGGWILDLDPPPSTVTTHLQMTA